MRTEQLEYLAAVARLGSLRRAGDHLGVSQPTIGEAVTKLEQELGTTLLDRRRSGASLTRQGRELLQYVAQILDSVERLRTAANDSGGEPAVVRVGTVNAGTSILLSPALRAFQQVHPATEVEIVDARQDEIQQRLLDGGLDLGLVNLLSGDDVHPQLIGTALLHGQPVAVLNADHALAKQTSITVDQLRAEPFISMSSGYLMHRFAHRIFGPQLPASRLAVDGATMGKTMVAEGLGIALLPDYSVIGDYLLEAGRIVLRPIDQAAPTVTLMLLHPRREYVAEPVRHLRELFIRAANAAAASSRPS